ncbi:MAG: glycosyltransferase family 4 protein [Candidatus Binatia bacterium]|nr:glycosyltransferase family 4 protein [Candidatus Binatia bacterium]
MRALHVFPLFSADRTNGASHHTFVLSRHLQSLGVEVEIFSTTTSAIVPHAAFGLKWPDRLPREETAAGLRVRRFPVTFSPSVKLGRAFSKEILERWETEALPAGAAFDEWLRAANSRPRRYDWMSAIGRGPTSLGLLAAIARESKNIDVILVGYAPFSMVGQVTWLARALRKPVVVLPLFHANDPYHHFRSVYGSFERADRVLVETPYAVDLFRRAFPKSTPVEIGVGVEPEDFRDEAVSGERFRSLHGLGDKPIVLMVGRKEPAKRWDLSVQAIDRVKKAGATLVLVGREVDGLPIESSRVLHLTDVDDQALRDAYDACNVLVHPSENESFGLVLLEAWMRQKPVIGSRVCGAVASVISEDVDGLLCDGADDLAAKIDRLLDAPELAARFGRAGREKARSRYPWAHIAGRVKATYQELLER